MTVGAASIVVFFGAGWADGKLAVSDRALMEAARCHRNSPIWRSERRGFFRAARHLHRRLPKTLQSLQRSCTLGSAHSVFARVRLRQDVMPRPSNRSFSQKACCRAPGGRTTKLCRASPVTNRLTSLIGVAAIRRRLLSAEMRPNSRGQDRSLTIRLGERRASQQRHGRRRDDKRPQPTACSTSRPRETPPLPSAKPAQATWPSIRRTTRPPTACANFSTVRMEGERWPLSILPQRLAWFPCVGLPRFARGRHGCVQS